MSPWRGVFSLLSPAGARGRLSVFIFHRVLPQPDPIFPDEVDAVRFDNILGWLADWFHVLPLDEAARRLQSGSLPARAAAITFDDGYADNHAVALPLLRRHGLPATFFVATGFLDGGRMWNDTVIEAVRRCPAPTLDLSVLGLGQHDVGSVPARRAAIGALIRQIKYLPADERAQVTQGIADAAGARLPADLMMSSEQVRELDRAGMQIGAHTVSHPILARLDGPAARREIDDSRQFLEALIGHRVTLFAYPNGRPGSDYVPEHARLVQELGFDAAVSTAWGTATRDTDPFQIPRFTPWDRGKLKFGLRTMRNIRQSAALPG